MSQMIEEIRNRIMKLENLNITIKILFQSQKRNT